MAPQRIIDPTSLTWPHQIPRSANHSLLDLNALVLLQVTRFKMPPVTLHSHARYGEFQAVWFNNQSSTGDFKQTELLRTVLGIISQFAAYDLLSIPTHSRFSGCE